jgi:polyisoprenoid-binding protein YceI
MKRTLLALTFVLAMATLAFGQTYTIDKNQHSVEIKGKASDIVTETGDNLVKIFDLSRKDAAQYYSIPSIWIQ